MARHIIVNQITVTTAYVNCNVILILDSLREICDHYILNSLYNKREILIYTHIYYLLPGLSPQANYNDRATAACRRN
jgi:hypothetical protein